ncbi:MAG: TIGR04086 family membrane protein [Bacilli bacterium]|nr:TIGR04086 family membrane protein [Bacilli bacterium]
MNTFYKYLKSLIIFMSSIIIIPFFLSLFNLLKLETNKIMIIIIGSILMFIIGFILGRKSNSKGYLNGLLLSVICIFILVILSLIFRFSLNINTLIYYVILVISTVFGSMLGINKKVKNKV